MRRLPNKPTPIGCLMGFLSLFPAIFSGLMFWGASRAFSQVPPAEDIGYRFIRWGVFAAIPAVAGFVFCIYRIATIGKRSYYQVGSSLSS